MHPLVLMLAIPVLAGLLAYFVGRLRNEFCFIGAIGTLYYAVRLFMRSRGDVIEYVFARLGTLPLGSDWTRFPGSSCCSPPCSVC
jgi:hypothetical protein